MKNTPENRVHAQAVLDYIAAHPEKHDQGNWFHGEGCGTTMCIGGTATWLEYGKKSLDMNTEYAAAHLLGLSISEREVLFYEMDRERALAKLEKVAKGEPLTKNDFYVVEESGEDPLFQEYYWEKHLEDYPHLTDEV